MCAKQLNEFDFVDLYVCLEGDAEPHYQYKINKENPDGNIDVPPEFNESVAGLTNYLREKFVNNEMGVTYEGARMRAAKVRTSGGLLWAALRKINEVPPALEKLSFLPAWLPHLRALGKRSGLILMCGATGQGKTTTACSLLREYLALHGGVAFTIEDPVEYDLEGRHQKSGMCYQVEVREDPEWAEMLKRALRWHPRYIFVGEVRTPEAANQLLRAATSGHLVITTMHSGSIEEALEGLVQLAAQAVGEQAHILLAAGIAAIMHQTLTPQGINLQAYITEPVNPAAPFRNCIREKRIGQVRTFVDQQVALLMQSGKLFRDGSG